MKCVCLFQIHLPRNLAINSSDEVMHIYGHGNKSKRLDQDMNDQDGKSFQHWLTDSTVATEMDAAYNDHLGVPHDSAETVKKEDLPRINKGDRVLKKAEKLAGPIQSAEYWYDFQAGFWGVVGHPCLGIIPPNIEEFNYLMPVKCAGGNTEVFVNGRELHQKDLDLLACRGLPTARNKFYLIEISGRVVDEDTGEELDGLGKLAPTVERVKHGFGMKVPRTLLEQDP